jgi:hypothetical protein
MRGEKSVPAATTRRAIAPSAGPHLCSGHTFDPCIVFRTGGQAFAPNTPAQDRRPDPPRARASACRDQRRLVNCWGPGLRSIHAGSKIEGLTLASMAELARKSKVQPSLEWGHTFDPSVVFSNCWGQAFASTRSVQDRRPYPRTNGGIGAEIEGPTFAGVGPHLRSLRRLVNCRGQAFAPNPPVQNRRPGPLGQRLRDDYPVALHHARRVESPGTDSHSIGIVQVPLTSPHMGRRIAATPSISQRSRLCSTFAMHRDEEESA